MTGAPGPCGISGPPPPDFGDLRKSMTVCQIARRFGGKPLAEASVLAVSSRSVLTTPGDVGVETAFNEIDTIAATVFLDKKYPNLCATGACNYYPTRQATDSAGIPTVINWALVPSTTVDNSYTVQYVLDRLCDAPLPVTDVRTQCMNTGAALVGSKNAGVEPLSKPVQVYYRATVRVVGPRNTESIVQALYAH